MAATAYYIWVGGLEHVLFFHSAGNFIIPTDEVIFFRGIGVPPTRYIKRYNVIYIYNIYNNIQTIEVTIG